MDSADEKMNTQIQLIKEGDVKEQARNQQIEVARRNLMPGDKENMKSMSSESYQVTPARSPLGRELTDSAHHSQCQLIQVSPCFGGRIHIINHQGEKADREGNAVRQAKEVERVDEASAEG